MAVLLRWILRSSSEQDKLSLCPGPLPVSLEEANVGFRIPQL